MQTTDHGIDSVVDNSLQDVITRLMSDMQPFAKTNDRRDINRRVLTNPVGVFIEVETPHGLRKLHALVRDISVDGIGLLHDDLFTQSEVVVTLFTTTSAPTNLLCRIIWTGPRDDGGFRSGVRIMSEVTTG